MLSRADADAARAAKQVQEHAPTWWVIWSLRFRRFEAWEWARCRTVHADSAGELWDSMQQVDLDLWRTRPRDDQPPAPGAAGRLGPPLPAPPGPDLTPRGQPPEPRGKVPEPRLPFDERSRACSRPMAHR